MLAESEAEKKGSTIEVEKSKCSNISIAHVKEYPSMHHFGIPRHTHSMITYEGLAIILGIPVQDCIAGMLLTCPIVESGGIYSYWRCNVIEFVYPFSNDINRLEVLIELNKTSIPVRQKLGLFAQKMMLIKYYVMVIIVFQIEYEN